MYIIIGLAVTCIYIPQLKNIETRHIWPQVLQLVSLSLATLWVLKPMLPKPVAIHNPWYSLLPTQKVLRHPAEHI